MGELIDVWLDDQRPAPSPEWLWLRHTWAVVALLKRGAVRRLSLDHNLGIAEHGRRENTGLDLVIWMAENGRWPVARPTVHSRNEIAAFAMQAVIDKYAPPDLKEDS